MDVPAPGTTVDGTTLAEGHPRLELLVLLGSHATGTAHATSDWDIGCLGGGLDVETLAADLSHALCTDDVDLVDLAGASAVLRRDAAMTGRPLFEREPGAFAAFQIEAITFWCEVEPVLREAHADVLRALAR